MKKISLLIMFLFFVLASACGQANTENFPSESDIGSSDIKQPEISPTESPAPSLFAQVSETEGQVQLRQPDKSVFSDASVGDYLQESGELRTGGDGRTRIDLSDDSILRFGPSSHFILTSLEGQPEDTITRLRILTGKLWAILNGESLEIDTPAGIASVRGSYIGVKVNKQNDRVTVNCFEGQCSVTNPAGTVELVAGQASELPDRDTSPSIAPISDEDFQEWIDQNPESQDILPIITQTAQAWHALTPTPTPRTPGGNGSSSGGGGGEVIAFAFTNAVTVSSSTFITLRFGWAADSAGSVQEFFDAAKFTFTLDGVTLPDSESYFSGISGTGDMDGDGDEDFAGHLYYDLEYLSPGTHIVEASAPAHAPITDGTDWDGDGSPDTYSGPWNFTVTITVTE